MNNTRGSRERWAEILYRRVVALYPSAFRQKYGPDVELLVSDLADDPSVPTWRLWLLLWRDLLHSVVREHLENLTGGPPTVRVHSGGPLRALAQGAGGVSAVVAAFIIIAASGLPYAQFSPNQGELEPWNSYSILGLGDLSHPWFVAEPVGIAVLAIAAGVLLVLWMSPIPRAIASGVLLASGVQAILLFGGDVYLFLGHRSLAFLGHWSLALFGLGDIVDVLGCIVGLIGGILLLVCGLAPAVSAFARKSAPAMQGSLAGATAGVTAMLAALTLIAAGALPYLYCSGICGTGVLSFSAFAGGTGEGWQFLLEGEMANVLVGIEVLAIVAGIVLVVPMSRRILRAMASGVLLACAVQTIFLFGRGVIANPGELAYGAVVGMLAGLLLLLGGLAHARTFAARSQWPEEPSTG